MNLKAHSNPLKSIYITAAVSLWFMRQTLQDMRLDAEKKEGFTLKQKGKQLLRQGGFECL